MTIATRGSNAVEELAKVLGLDTSKTHRFSLSMSADDVVTMHAEVYPDEDQLTEFVKIIKKYELVEKK